MAQAAFEAIKKELILGTEEEKEFRFCGTEIKQDIDFSIKITCKMTSKKLGPIRLSRERAKQTDQPVTPDEQEQLMSVVVSLMWICQCCRPGISYGVSKLQYPMKKAIVEDMLLANKIVKIVQEGPEAGLTYRPGLMWPSKPGETPQIIVMAVSDASHGNEEEYLDDWDEHEAFRSQGAEIVFITDAAP
eukprot:14652398-Heterocapsa_arctica.AAC.1